MQQSYLKLLDNNKVWVKEKLAKNPDYFLKLSQLQAPDYLWIGCSDSRVPANEITGTEPGEVFVHRNIANMVVHTDMNMLSVLDYAVNVLHVKHIIVCGHYGCGGVLAAMGNQQFGLIDNWLRHIKDVRDRHSALIAAAPESAREDVLCELNVIEQVMNVAQTTVMQDAWARGQKVSLHGWVYGLQDGLLQDLHITLNGLEGLDSLYRAAIAGVAGARR